MGYLHDSKCVHNDLKPDNFLCIERFEPDAVPRVVITDYGLLRTLEQMATATALGDLRYLSPDRWRQELGGGLAAHKEFQKDDIWAMGVTLHELLSSDGSLPFLGRHVTLHDLMNHTRECSGGLTTKGTLVFDPECPAC